MTIGFDGSRAFVSQKTGTENYSRQILKNLSLIDDKNNYQVFLRPQEVLAETDSWPANFKFQTLNYLRLWTQVGLAVKTFTNHSLDVLFVPSHTLPIIRRPSLKTVITVHDLGAEYLPQTHQLKQRLYLGLMTKFQLQGADHIIAVSQATKDDLIKQVGLNPGKISVIYEGLNPDLFKPLPRRQQIKTLANFKLKPKQYFLFVGTIQPRKNLDRLIRAFKKFLEQNPKDKSNLVLAGGRGWLSDQIYNLPQQLKIANRVRFLGYVPDDALPALYNGAQALLFPSLFEGFGLPIIEAFACNCPVLTSNISSMAEIAGPAAFLVDPYSVSDIADGINQLRNPKLAAKLIKLGSSRKTKFRWEQAASETLKVLQKVTSS